MATYTLKDLWIKACKHDGIEPDSKFVVFDKANPWAVKYNRLALLIAQAPRIPNQPSERPLSYRTKLASDIEMFNYELAKKQGPSIKAALTRAKSIADPAKRYKAVHAACTKAVKAWEQWGAWPDAWSLWQIALDDAFYALQRAATWNAILQWPTRPPILEDL